MTDKKIIQEQQKLLEELFEIVSKVPFSIAERMMKIKNAISGTEEEKNESKEEPEKKPKAAPRRGKKEKEEEKPKEEKKDVSEEPEKKKEKEDPLDNLPF